MADNIPGGYNGKILRVNLSEGKITEEALDPLVCRRYIGGAGFVAYYLWKELKPGIDALSPENKLIFALGPVSGLLLPGASRNCVGAKSPLAGAVAKSEVGGFWPAEMKRTGYDAVIVEGSSKKPLYLWIHDGKAEIKDARHLWGKETKETQEAIHAELGDDKVQVAMIGPGGENLVRFACIMNGLHDAAGRGGLGAVMGSKNLKAIAVRGHTLPPIADAEKIQEIRKSIPPHPVSEFGTGGAEMLQGEKNGDLPIHNFRDGVFPGVEKISGLKIKETIRIRMEGCFACPIRCKKVVQTGAPYNVDPEYGGPEYETLAALGSNCDVDDLAAVCKGNELCSAYSIDTIAAGSAIAFTMECFEKGLIDAKDYDGIKLSFGNKEDMLKAIHLIAKREGPLGNLMAEGSARMAKKIGQDSEKFAMQVKGVDSGMHEPRAQAGLGMGYALNPHGADHCSSMIDDFFCTDMKMDILHMLGIQKPLGKRDMSPKKVAVLKIDQQKAMMEDMMVMCTFPEYSYQKKADLLKAVTGWDITVLEWLRAAERTMTLLRMFDIREGFTSADDTLPERFFQPKTGGFLVDKPYDRVNLERAKQFYYALMGWDMRGVPLPEKLIELGIE